MIKRLSIGFEDREESQRSKAYILPRLVSACYFVLLIGVTALLWEAVEVYWQGRSVTLGAVVLVALALVLVPPTVWAINRQERRLHLELDDQDQQLERRLREIKGLNKLFQSYLMEQFADSPRDFREPEGVGTPAEIVYFQLPASTMLLPDGGNGSCHGSCPLREEPARQPASKALEDGMGVDQRLRRPELYRETCKV